MFNPEPNPVPTSIGVTELRVRTQPDGEGGIDEQVTFYYEVLDADGGILGQRRGNAASHLTAQEIQGLRALMARARTLAGNTLP